MIKIEAKLKENLFSQDISQVATRDGFGEGLILLGEDNPQVVVLCADLADSTRTKVFRDRFPERFIEVGIGEQNMAGVASGLAACGKIPFIASYAAFSPGRNWEQIRTAIAYNDVPVKIIGAHAGVSVGPDGATHQAIEDIAIMRVIPNMIVIVPCDSIETRKATLEIAKISKPVYLRFAREKTPVFTTEETPFTIGKAEIFWQGENPQVAIIACGPLVYNSLRAAKELTEEGINSLVINNHTIKPLDEETIIKAAKDCGRVVTVEEHQVLGGMGSAVAELLAKNYPVPIEFIGVKDRFGESGDPQELIEALGMDVSHIKEAVKKVLKR